ncbi:unnamed protein product, partial [Laminaria digitata]
MRRCLYQQCQRFSTSNFEGSKTPIYCKPHAKDITVDVRNKRCSHPSWTSRPGYNVEGSKTAVLCRHNAEDGMVLLGWKLC